MSAESFKKYWQKLARIFDLDIELNFPIRTGKSLFIAPVVLKNFGSELGMILVTDFKSIESVSDELQNLGYGISTLSEPLTNEDFDKNSTMEMLYDWGWSGLGEPPGWYEKERT